VTLKQIFLFGLACAAGSVLAILTFDRPLAVAMASLDAPLQAPFSLGTAALEHLSLWAVSKYLIGFVLLALGLVLQVSPTRRSTANLLVALAVAHMTSRLIAGILKNVFLRSRPYELLVSQQWEHSFFVTGGSSFPSAHAAHFWGFFFVLAFAFPRWRIPLLLIPTFVTVARVVVNDHFAGDVLAGMAIAALVSAAVLRGGQAWPRLALVPRAR
jgi:membrane-associated phospholipid phosphatase